MKKTLLIAAAALAAGVISTQAQVYSQNIVGYANVATPTPGAQYLIAVPFTVGVSNGANEVFGTTLPDFTSLLIWDVAANNYTAYLADSTSPTLWDNANFDPVPAPILPVGKGFFLSPNGNNLTNTFVGTVAVTVGTSNVMTLPTAGANYLVGCVVPYAGSITNGSNSGGGANLNGLPDFSSVLIWDTSINNFKAYLSDSSSPTLWDNSNFDPVPAPSISVGQGFFIAPNGANVKWTTGL